MPPDTRIIQLTQGQVAIVDASDYRRLSKHKWYAVKRSNGVGFYAARNKPQVSGRPKRVWMHHEVRRTFPRPGILLDHKDGDGLHNWWANLRMATVAENNRNKRMASVSGYRGVQQTPTGLWRAKMRIDGKSRHLGTYESAEAAARAYDVAAIANHGGFAVLNFPPKPRRSVKADPLTGSPSAV